MIENYEKELREIASAKAKLEKREKEIKCEIKKEHDCEFSKTYGGLQVQVISGYFTTEFDLDLFKQENYELYSKYQKESYKAPQIKVVLLSKKGEVE